MNPLKPKSFVQFFNKYPRSIFSCNYTCKADNSKCDPPNAPPQICTVSECMIGPCQKEPSVIIIGAGMAGLSAAQRLVQCGITNFHILEATERFSQFSDYF